MSAAQFRRFFGGRARASQASPMNQGQTGTLGRRGPPNPNGDQAKGDIADIDPNLTREDASIEARRSGFARLRAAASHHPTDPDKRLVFFETVITPVHHSLMDLQIDILDILTENGRNIAPFEAAFVGFLNKTLRELFFTVENIREERGTSRAGDSVWTSQSATRGAGSGSTTRNSKFNDPDGPSQLLEGPSGSEKALLDTFYLVANTVIHHPQAFHDAQLEILLTTATTIAKKTTMRRALRGSLKIFSAVGLQHRLPENNLKPTVMALCAILGNPNLKFREEAWQCLSGLLSSIDSVIVGNMVISPLVSPPDPSKVRDFAKIRGAVHAIQRIAQTEDLTRSIIPSLRALVTGLVNTWEVDKGSAQEIVQATLALLMNDHIAQLLIHEDWQRIRDEVDKTDQQQNLKPYSEQTSPFTNQNQDEISSNSPLHGFAQIRLARIFNKEDGFQTPLQAIAERLLWLLERNWQHLGSEKCFLVLRILLYLTLHVPAVLAPVIERIWDLQLFEPPHADWKAHIELMVRIVDADPQAFEMAKCSIIKVFQNIYPALHSRANDKLEYEKALRNFCSRLRAYGPQSAIVLGALAELAAEVGRYVTLDTFEKILGPIQEVSETVDGGIQIIDAIEKLPHSLVELFLECYQQSYSKTSRLYSLILTIAKKSLKTSAKLHLIKLLLRLRCDADFALTIGVFPPAEDAVKNLCKVPNSGKTFDPHQASSSRPSTYGQVEVARTGRSSAVDFASGNRSRSATRSINAKDRRHLVVPPAWALDDSTQEQSEERNHTASLVVYVQKVEDDDTNVLDLSQWLDLVTSILRGDNDWELYTYLLVHLPIQLSNCSLFRHHVKSLQILQNTVVMQLNNADFHEPPLDSGIKKGDVAVCLYQILVTMFPYHNSFSRRMTDDTIRTFRLGVEKWDRTARSCIRALALCCYEMPFSIERQIVGITEMMQKRVTQAELAMEILEFLGCLARTNDAYGEADAAFYRRIFGICIRYLQYNWEQRQKMNENAKYRASVPLGRQSGSSAELARASGPFQTNEAHGLSEYVFATAYQTIIFWFLAIDVRERAQHVGWLTQELSWKDESGKEYIQEQSLVILDMMHRTTFSNLGETVIDPEYADSNKNIIRKMWLVGMSIVTTEIIANHHVGARQCGQLIKRQASGTTHATYFHNTAELPSHHVSDESHSSRSHSQLPLDVYPNHMLLQLMSTIAPTPIPLQPIPLPDDDFTRRAIKVFDSISTVDGHKAGVIYIGEGQDMEAEILANTAGDHAYETFLLGLGTKVPLKNAKLNPQGLDRLMNEDGTHTIAWRDRVTEIVFHVATMMPTDLISDPKCDQKKRHIGNDHVKIIFNASGQPFEFETFPSAMNTINILIAPEAHTRSVRCKTDDTPTQDANDPTQGLTSPDGFGYFIVQTFSSSSCPEISFAAEPKLVSAEALPAFVRQIAINASVFCQVWDNRHDEYFSNWRARLREIIKLRKRYANTNASANVYYPMAGSEQTASYADGDRWTGKITIGGMADADRLVNSMDFTRWT